MENPHRPKIIALRTVAELDLAKNARKQATTQRCWKHESTPLIDPRWPAGWWILPFSIGGLIEAVVLALWLTGHL